MTNGIYISRQFLFFKTSGYNDECDGPYCEYGKTNFCNIKYYFIKYVHSQMVLFGVAAKIGSKASKYSGSRTIIFSSSVTNTFVF